MLPMIGEISMAPIITAVDPVFKNTFGKMFDKGEGEGTITSFQAACTALANTIGTGNISGVATAIVSGGPGALVWMWISACYVAITLFFIYAKRKEIFALYDDFWKRFKPAKDRGENPPNVTFDCAAAEQSRQL